MLFLGLYLGHQSVSKPGPYLSVLQRYWNVHVWNRMEALFLSSVSRYLGLSIVFTSDLEYFALLSSVGCIGTFMVSVLSGRTRLPSYLLPLPGAASGVSRSVPLADLCRGGNHELRRLMDLSGRSLVRAL